MGAIFLKEFFMGNGIYTALYTLVQNAFYGSSALTGWQEMVLTIIATTGCLFVFVVPFMIVWKVVKVICGV